MSREIKFVGWDKMAEKGEEWFTWERLQTINYGKGSNNIFNDPDLDLYQFTGLHDKDGKGDEVYGGHRLKRTFGYYPVGHEDCWKNDWEGVVYFDVTLGGWFITSTLEDGFAHEFACQRATLRDFKIISHTASFLDSEGTGEEGEE